MPQRTPVLAVARGRSARVPALGGIAGRPADIPVTPDRVHDLLAAR